MSDVVVQAEDVIAGYQRELSVMTERAVLAEALVQTLTKQINLQLLETPASDEGEGSVDPT